MNPARKTSAILATAATLSAAAFFLSQATSPRAATVKPPPVQAGGLGLQAQLASTHILKGEHDAYMAVTLTAPEQDHQVRPMVDIAVVLDRSGSMEGEKLEQAKVAARQFINNLDQSDRFSLTVYGSDVEVLVPSTGATEAAKASAMSTIGAIYTDGGTNLSGGINAGRSQLLNLSETTGRVQRIVLISDGQANEGIVNRDELSNLALQAANQGVSITTVGVGLDFDEQTMTRVAVSGRGNYYYAETAGQLASLFDTELKRLGATVATHVSLQITPKNGVSIQDILGYSMIRSASGWQVNISDLHAGETRKVVMALHVNANGNGVMDLADIGATFVAAGEANQQRDKMQALQTSLRAEITSDASLVEKHRDRFANRLIERAKTAAAIDEATVLYESGRTAEADALMDRRAQAAQAIATDMGDTEFAAEMKATQSKVKGNFASAPASSTGGKKARKANRKDAYDLMY